MKLLSISFPNHDGNISYYDGKNLHYIKLERLKQIKRYVYHNKWEWMRDIKSWWNIDLNEIDEIAIHFDAASSYGLKNIPEEVQNVLDGKSRFAKIREEINPFKEYFNHQNIWFIGHHYAHSLSTWMLTNKTPDVSIVIDGMGDWKTWSVFRDDSLLATGNLNDGSFGIEMKKAGVYLNIEGSKQDLAGKVMGIQSYGHLDVGYLNYLQQFSYKQITEVFSRQNWHNYKTHSLLGDLSPLDWIRTVHERCGQLIVDLFADYANPSDVISYSGGVAQNVVWNSFIKKKFPNLIIPPHSGDEGLSLGGIEWLRRKNNLPKFVTPSFPYVQCDNSPKDSPSDEAIQYAAKLLAEGKIIAWYQGNGEVGPRALGNRSILMNPTIPNGKFLINTVKNRENYRPFGASILYEHVNDYFEEAHEDPYMLYVFNLKKDGFNAITHVDNTCRVQTVKSTDNVYFRKLIEEFYKLTDCPMILNTSLNVSGLPIAGYPEIAIDLLNNTPIDAAFIGNTCIHKTSS